MFSKKKKKIEISAPSNFQHRVHTGFDNHSNKFVGLPKQWASLVDDKPAAQSPYRPSPMVDPSTFTPEALDSRGQDGNHRLMNGSGSMASSVVRSNSLRSNLMKDALGMSHDEMASIMGEWNKGELDSFLIEISANILKYKDTDGEPLVEKIRDAAGQKGTGKWTAISALEYGMPVTLIGEAVFARCLSSIKSERMRASEVLKGPEVTKYSGDKKEFIEDIRKALYASKIVSYAQGFMLLREAANVFKWKLNYGGIALMWRGGCIIRSRFLGNIKAAYDKNSELDNLLLDDFFKNAINECQASWRKVVANAVQLGVPTPCFSTALAFYDGYRAARLPANLIQAQRDYFGAHTYELLSKPGTFVHTNWTGLGGNVSASTYDA